ncbi:Phosphoenolpyruvate carboxykinase [ATP] [Pseudobythopirellula maris]|uniref:Phosphoenolpyruvate carboxykinase (ATP) n=1 Tax=Pseudobythopirellula maris TaxID=2527991 RepID=A0A5C5ZSS2_9BACT|nr:phosphoenolpyruvate carboxykinase (ATP) [Pseudobythopirellula maris]TWT90584.1 Phosphoenolpyruvate carboxykinase [ATP] [Pseudobythopirellula maris]
MSAVTTQKPVPPAASKKIQPANAFDLSAYGITKPLVLRNASVAELYEHGIQRDHSQIASSGALVAYSGEKTGRSPKDKRVVREPGSEQDVWWGDVNIPLSPESFDKNRSMAIDFLNAQDVVHVVDGYAGWSPEERIKVRIICSRPYHALFMHNMLIRPTAEELADYGEPDFVVLNAGQCPADTSVEGVENETSVALNFATGEFVILGSEYAGEIKKGVFTIMNYLLPKRGVLSMHCSANVDSEGHAALFFGLSGTGKTTLSADPKTNLIGDDEHGWGPNGVFNIEGGCYAKCINLSPEGEPEIYHAIRFGTVLENTVQDPVTRDVDYSDVSLTQNTRASYPIEFIPHAEIPCVGDHPRDIVFLTCDAFGVLPPVSLLTPEQAMYHFISGYTAKVAGTEVGVTEPSATFSACFGAPFLVWHPAKYAELLAGMMRQHGSRAYLVNTGWSGGAYGTGERMSLKVTRAIIDAIHDERLLKAETASDEFFGLKVPRRCPHVPSELLLPENAWADKAAYEKTARKLAGLFVENFKKYEADTSAEVKAAGPRVG